MITPIKPKPTGKMKQATFTVTIDDQGQFNCNTTGNLGALELMGAVQALRHMIETEVVFKKVKEIGKIRPLTPEEMNPGEPTAPPIPVPVKICPTCKDPVPKESKFCDNCGGTLP